MSVRAVSLLLTPHRTRHSFQLIFRRSLLLSSTWSSLAIDLDTLWFPAFTWRWTMARRALAWGSFTWRTLTRRTTSRPSPRPSISRRRTTRTRKDHSMLRLKSQPLSTIHRLQSFSPVIKLRVLRHRGHKNTHTIMIERRAKLAHRIMDGIEYMISIANFNGLLLLVGGSGCCRW